MSHFPVLICLPADTELPDLRDAIAERMETWNESRDVEPYRNHEDGAPEHFWWVKSVRRGAEHHRHGTGVKPYRPDELGWSSDSSKLAEDEQRAEFARDAELSERLGEHPTWETVAKLYNERFGHHGSEIAANGDDGDSERLRYEPETGRAYTMSTYNPESKWDYWRIGGRWKDYFIAKAYEPGLIFGDRSWDSPKPTHIRERRCDGARIERLDFEAMRTEAERKAAKRYSEWEKVAAKHPPARGWDHFVGLVEAGALPIDTARREYREQPLIAEWDRRGEWGDCPVTEFLPPREEYLAIARCGAVPAYALVTLDREWIAPGRMGWFGMSTDGPGDREGYHAAVNQYLDQTNPATLLVVLDCHI